jgi:hypothetical protein
MSEYLSGLAPELAGGGEKISAKISRKTRAAKKVSAKFREKTLGTARFHLIPGMRA